MADYYKERDADYSKKAKAIISGMPRFCSNYFSSAFISLSSSTIYNYASRIDKFLRFLCADIGVSDVKKLSASEAGSATPEIVERFVIEELGDATDVTKNAYLSAVSAFYKFYVKRGWMDANPVEAITRPRRKKQPKVYLDGDDKERLSETMKTGRGLTEHMTKYNEKIGTKSRDLLILALLMDTGIRVSELVGIDYDDIDFIRHRFPVRRKGGNIDMVYFSDSTSEILDAYCAGKYARVREADEPALFISFIGKNKGRRISVRSVELIVKKYAKASGVANATKISPHKLRHTCAMALLKETGNISLVQKQLGHESIVSTTVYARADDSDLAAARNTVSSGLTVDDVNMSYSSPIPKNCYDCPYRDDNYECTKTEHGNMPLLDPRFKREYEISNLKAFRSAACPLDKK